MRLLNINPKAVRADKTGFRPALQSQCITKKASMTREETTVIFTTFLTF